MIRNTMLVAALALTSLVNGADGKEWATKMFKTTNHEFGHCARGGKTEFLFEMENCYEEDVHIAEVRTSCGCTTPTILKPTLKTWEKGGVLAVFNTHSFLGARKAEITVVIDKPFHAEVQLKVAGYIHSDVDFQPSSVAFGDLDQGAVAERKVAITFHNRRALEVTDVRGMNTSLEVMLGDAQRKPDRVTFEMTVRLNPDAPAGSLQDSLVLVTNDPKLPTVPIMVTGNVLPPLSVSPQPLFFSTPAGQSIKKQMVVRAKTPFKITAIECDDDAFQFTTSDQSKTVHLVPVTFTAGEMGGDLEREISIVTDLPTGGVVKCLVRASVQGAVSNSVSAAPGK